MFSYKNGRYYKNDQPFFVRGVEYQYYRDRKENWRERLQQLKQARANVVSFYIPWRHHFIDNDYDFTGKTKSNRDLVHFLDLCTEVGFYMFAKPGPFVHSELNIGGLPDITSPSFNDKITPVRKHNGEACHWDYDNAQLPSPNDAVFDNMTKEWLQQVAKIIEKHVSPQGNIIGIQLNDETIFCTSNEAPWNFGYDEPDVKFFRDMLAQNYNSIAKYNQLHATHLDSFDQVTPPSLQQKINHPRQLLPLRDWGQFQWWLRREVYARYKRYLAIESVYLTNYAGITPPIQENVPGKEPAAAHYLQSLYAEWWLAMNRIEADLDVHEYGMISWLGVAAYNIDNPRETALDNNCQVNEVFQRYINTARRRRGINIEENWGFAKLYHPFSRYPLIPFFQTLASVAGGCTGFIVFCGVQHDHWDSQLDSVTKQQHPTFPSDAPICCDGKLTPMYDTMTMLNTWFEKEQDYLQAELKTDFCWLTYAPYAAISSWFAPHSDMWQLQDKIPRCAFSAWEQLTMNMAEDGYVADMLDIEGVSLAELQTKPLCMIQLAFFMDQKTQQKLLDYVEKGGRIICCGERPYLDGDMHEFSLLSNYLHEGKNRVGLGEIHYYEKGSFAEKEFLPQVGVEPCVSFSENMRAFVYTNDEDYYIWFFHFSRQDVHHTQVLFYEKKLELWLGSKACGVVHIKGNKIVSAMCKGNNEVENIESTTKFRFLEEEVGITGDGIWFNSPEG
ncbi:beta-galactosidase [Candidatus Uabimicrobium amorphum]|uniref:Glycoside hydrolase n=1 Tax=Uabimicrobium amorphum TaxID=2596890 RepID=A0A5S9F5W2_UABAM|nr:beta-galactosidase [Candidatus Uabimicrobium amorphum]BBM87277.1 glycoside hydrolase [Candidatus Uabimicrobium amorphum]